MEGLAFSKSAMSLAWLGGPHSLTHHSSHLSSTWELAPAATYGVTANVRNVTKASNAAVPRDGLVRIRDGPPVLTLLSLNSTGFGCPCSCVAQYTTMSTLIP